MSHNLGGMAPYVSMPRGRNQMYYPQFPGGEPPPHMQRGPCFPDDKMNCGMMMGEFKPPMMSNPEPPPPKKKRRTSNNAASNQPPPPVMQDLLPPPLTGYGDTIVASNPFDDTPPQPPMNLNHMQHHGMPHHMNNRHMPCSPHMMHMSGPGPCQMGGSPINCGPPMGSPMGPMNCGPQMGGMNNCGPMNCGPGMGSPIGPNRSPLVCSSGGGMISCGPPQSSPMNHPMNRSPSIGSPLGPVMNAMSGPPTGSPMDCGKGSPMQVVGQHGMSCNSPMGSPLANGPMGGGSCVGPPISSPMGNTCGMSDMGGGVMNRSPMNGPMGSPMCGMGGPSPHMSGPPSHMGGPSPHMSGPSPHMGGPSPHMGGPSPHMGGPSPHMGGPSPHMGGPSPHMGGPSPHMGGPSPHMGGPSPHMGGPSPHMGGPSPHMGGPSPHMGGPSPHMSGPSSHMNNTNVMNNMNNMNSMSSMGNMNAMNPMGSGGDSMNMNSAVGKGLNNGPPVSVNAGVGVGGPPINTNGPMRGQMMNHNHSANMMQSMHSMGMGHPHNYTGHKPMPVSAGKIYPVDQPMVFNPQNPNAPPIYPCGICHKEVHDNDQAILCESGCNFWFHRVCTGLIEAAYQLLTAEVYAEWVCDKCLASKNIPLVKFKP